MFGQTGDTLWETYNKRYYLASRCSYRVIGYVYMSFHGNDVYVKESLRFSCLYYIIREETFSTNVTHLILE